MNKVNTHAQDADSACHSRGHPPQDPISILNAIVQVQVAVVPPRVDTRALLALALQPVFRVDAAAAAGRHVAALGGSLRGIALVKSQGQRNDAGCVGEHVGCLVGSQAGAVEDAGGGWRSSCRGRGGRAVDRGSDDGGSRHGEESVDKSVGMHFWRVCEVGCWNMAWMSMVLGAVLGVA